ncbi:MAG: MarR family transcriptional regulator [Clostridia bacterium]|nr:MarR family transcriptional regulator [Clostridia bacterium]
MQERFETFTVLINRISRSIRRIKNLEMASYGLRSPHISCLYYLYMFRGITATELCEKCEEDKATVSRCLDYLEANGYLTCHSKSTKRYKSPLVLTEAGLEAGQRIAAKIENVLQEISGALTEEERLSFYRSLSVISQSLESVFEESEKNSVKRRSRYE